MILKKGTKITLKPDFENYRHDRDPGVNDGMRRLAGQTMTIANDVVVMGKEYVTIRVMENSWFWSTAWFDFETYNEVEDISETEILNMFG